MSTITEAQTSSIADYLATHELPSGLGTKESACSIAAINLVLTGELTDKIPDCMSLVIGRWIIRTQDALTHEIRNSREWKALLPLAAGTGCAHEQERKDIILNWMWCDVLPKIQAYADARGFGTQWREMCEQKTADSARRARTAAAADAHAADATHAAAAAAAAADAHAADAATHAAAAARADAHAADAATHAAAAARAAYAADARADYWTKVDPIALLAKLIAVTGEKTA